MGTTARARNSLASRLPRTSAVHEKLLALREGLGGHNSYDKIRGAGEIMEFANARKTHPKIKVTEVAIACIQAGGMWDAAAQTAKHDGEFTKENGTIAEKAAMVLRNPKGKLRGNKVLPTNMKEVKDDEISLSSAACVGGGGARDGSNGPSWCGPFRPIPSRGTTGPGGR